MDTQELLIKVKQGMLMSGNYNDDSLMIFINEAIEHMRDAGIKDEFIKSEKSIGLITLITSDLYGTDKKLSDYTKSRIIQARMKQGEGDV